MIFLYLLLGLIVGVLSGVVGIGGGILIVPVLVFFFHMSQHKAQGTSLGALLAPIGALAFWEYYKAGNADLKAALLIGLGFIVGGYFGGPWAQHQASIWKIRCCNSPKSLNFCIAVCGSGYALASGFSRF
jgi:uncharacterized membrane protein YfcA